jgi:hypothetical protein
MSSATLVDWSSPLTAAATAAAAARASVVARTAGDRLAVRSPPSKTTAQYARPLLSTAISALCPPQPPSPLALPSPACAVIKAAPSSAGICSTAMASSSFSALHGVPSLGRVRLLDLPDDLIVCILVLLDADDVARLARVCRRLHAISSSDYLWRTFLAVDRHTWLEYGDHVRSPEWRAARSRRDMYRLAHPSRHACKSDPGSPSIWCRMRRVLSATQPRRVVITGPGLNHCASGFVRQLFWSQNSPFRLSGLVPGDSGVGSGVAVTFGSLPVHLITLYTSTRAERTAPGYSFDLEKATVERALVSADAVILVLDATMDQSSAPSAPQQQQQQQQQQGPLPRENAQHEPAPEAAQPPAPQPPPVHNSEEPLAQRLDEMRSVVRRMASIGPLHPRVPLCIVSATHRGRVAMSCAALADEVNIERLLVRHSWRIFQVNVDTLSGCGRSVAWTLSHVEGA